jgi:hypothetical protein
MTYEQKLSEIQKWIPPAMDRLFVEFSEAMLSFDKEKVITALVAKIKLDLPEISSSEQAFDVLRDALANLILQRKLEPKSFGYSPLGAEEVRELIATIAPVQTVAPLADDFSDVLAVYAGPVEELNKRMKTEPFRTRFNAAVAAGRI